MLSLFSGFSKLSLIFFTVFSGAFAFAAGDNQWPFQCPDQLISSSRITAQDVVTQGKDVGYLVPREAKMAIKNDLCEKAPGEISSRYGGYRLSIVDCENGQLGFRKYHNRYFAIVINVQIVGSKNPSALVAELYQKRGRWNLGEVFIDDSSGE